MALVFVEIEGRYATIVKNLLDLKSLTAGLDPRADFYSERNAHLRITKELLDQSANRTVKNMNFPPCGSMTSSWLSAIFPLFADCMLCWRS